MWMLHGQRKESWDHTANVLAMLHNVNCMDASSRITPLDAHPYRRKAQSEDTAIKISVDDLAGIYGK